MALRKQAVLRLRAPLALWATPELPTGETEPLRLGEQVARMVAVAVALQTLLAVRVLRVVLQALSE